MFFWNTLMSLLNQYYKNWLYVYPSPLNGRSYVQSKVGRSWYMRKDILVVASTFNCWILGFRVLFRVLQHISIVSLFHILKQAAWKKLQKKRKSSSSVSVPIKSSLRRCHNCGSHRVVIIVVSIIISLRLGHQWFAKSAKVFPPKKSPRSQEKSNFSATIQKI